MIKCDVWNKLGIRPMGIKGANGDYMNKFKRDVDALP
jgi:hypothetical protein